MTAVALVLIGVPAIAASVVAATTVTLVKDIRPGSESSSPDWLTNVAGRPFFSA